MNTFFTADFFSTNRARLQALIQDTVPIVIAANGVLQANADNTFPFRQDSSFWYLTGLDLADYTLVITSAETYLIAPSYDSIKDVFDGTTDLQTISATSGISTVLSTKEGWARLRSDLNATKRVATLEPAPTYIASFGLYTNPARARLVRQMKRACTGLMVRNIRPELAKLRVVKQAPEIAAIQKAVDITCATLNEVQHRTYDYEYEIEADITQGFRKQGAGGHAYTPIVAGGLNSCTLHYLQNDDQLRAGELLLADVGASVQNYAADITRTWSRDTPSDRQRAVFDAVNEALAYGIGLLQPGTTFHDVEQQIRVFVGDKLVKLGLIPVNTPEAVHEWYPHAPHYLGLDVHDVGDYRQPLEPGMVLTLEPGIYLPAERIGIRLEEDILITPEGCTVLSAACPRELTTVQ